ncbi:MAG: hypothetical protein CMG66_02340 [Candidatus Marinimicrobia bacterium]|nr:hypothetical protein [Candidatus Neomarinimicrobiota bacterium]|tara:strand:- start:5383 stop:5943 length:561 start_codon:yes stop_codon:yes gene_type:complete
MGRTYLVGILFLLYFGCDRYPSQPRFYKLSKDIVVDDLSDDLIQSKENEENFIWNVPKHWIPKDKGSVRLASYQIPVLDYFADISVTKFGGDAGGIKANVNRWRKQLDLNPQTIEIIQSEGISGSNSLGRYTIHKIINTEKPESGFLCMILPLKNSTVFVKLNSTLYALDILEQEFNAFCSSFRQR